MKEIETNWSKEDLKVYVMICCANADFVESKVELDFIKSKTIGDCFERMHAEFIKNNDYQSIQKIRSALERHGYSKDDASLLFKEVKELFLSDGKYDILEQNLLMGLNRIFGQ